MKKFFITLCSVVVLAVAANAQTTEVSKADKAAEKEAKAKAKEKQNQDIDDAIKSIGVSSDVAKSFKETMQVYATKSSEIKKNTSLSEEEKEKQLKANQDEKNAKLKEIIGEDKYKEFNKIRKAQKEKEGTAKQ